MPSPSVAVIDLGSNSIKLLVAIRDEHGHLVSILSRTLDVRIGAGISQTPPRLSENGMAAGLEAVQTLLADTKPFAPGTTTLVATSAVRDAANGAEFRKRIETATGHRLLILSGDEEADLIGRGLLSDPQLGRFQDFYVFDLGGGSLECLSFRKRRSVAAVSFPLGCVRLTELYVADPSAPFGERENESVRHAVAQTFRSGGFRFDLGLSAQAVFTGGTMTTTRAALAHTRGQTLSESPAQLSVEEIATVFRRVADMTLAERRASPDLPAARADVFPAALATILEIAHLGRLESFHHSVCNLRWGLADRTLPTGA